MIEAEFDFGDEGVLLIEAQEPQQSGMQPVSRGGERLQAGLQKVVASPLMAFSRVLAEALPKDALENGYEVDEFTVEFGLDVAAEVGKDGGVDGFVAKIMPNGTFKCTYTWKRRSAAGEADSD